MRGLNRCIMAAAALATLCLAGIGSGVAAGAPAAPRWREVKCERYKRAWAQATARLGTRGLTRDFLRRHDAFLASGCTANVDVCPSSAEELRLANIMVVLAMNAGTASTFPPFRCGK